MSQVATSTTGETMKPETIMIDNVEYVRKDTLNVRAIQHEGLEYVIVRASGPGVFAGYLKGREGNEAVLIKARRLWRWAGAASLSQLAMEGVKKPGECKFPCEVDEITIIGVIEIIPATRQAQDSIEGVAIWKM